MTALCRRCDDNLVACRLCWADNYVRAKGRVRAPVDAARPYAGVRVCGNCNSPATTRCGGCKTVAYCSTTCQVEDWHRHKPVCAMVRGAVPVFWIYDWHKLRVEKLRDWALMDGAEAAARFYRCFGGGDCVGARANAMPGF